MTNHPRLVSVIIPVYNCERYLGEAIESALAQGYNPIEIIVVDDGSTDRTKDVVMRFGGSVRCVSQPHGGAGAARNRGVEMTSGEFVAFLDADDVWMEGKTKTQMAAFDSDPNLDVVFGYLEQFHSTDVDEATRKKVWCPVEPMPGTLTSTMMIKRVAFYRAGPFEVTPQAAEFMSWYLRAMEHGLRKVMLPDVVARRRLHASNSGIRMGNTLPERLQLLKASLDRRRAATQSHTEPE